MRLKRPRDLDIMAEAAVINREALELVEAAIAPGVSTAELNAIAHDAIVARGGKPAFLGYKGSGNAPFPGTLCTSLNEIVVHGIPNKKPLLEGDILSIDIGTFYRGFAADMAKTYAIGGISDEAQRLLDVTKQALWAGIAVAQAGKRLGDVSAAIQGIIESAGFWVIREFVGHGIGRDFHEAPEVPNFGRAGTGPLLRPGLVLAIEPMVATETTKVHILQDGWTAPTAKGCLAAHFEHTVVISKDGPRILTEADQTPRLLGQIPALAGHA